MDNITKKQRKKCMKNIKGSDTELELSFRKYIWNKGLRGYRVNNSIKGKPDLYFPKQKIAIFIDGCFWHKCPECYVRPKSRNKYWDAKIENNVKRDEKITKELTKQGIDVLRFWGHEIKNNIEKCYQKLKKLHNEK
jgi:DNA mismatch endonuclease (patch repair protein)